MKNQKESLRRAKELEKALKDAKRLEQEELRRRQELNKKRREENAKKTEVVQMVRFDFLTLVSFLEALIKCFASFHQGKKPSKNKAHEEKAAEAIREERCYSCSEIIFYLKNMI